MEKETIIIGNDVSTVEMLRIHTLKDLTPSEFGQFLIYIEDLYRLSLIFMIISRKLKLGLRGNWRKDYEGEKRYIINKKYINEVCESDDSMGLFTALDSRYYSRYDRIDINSWKSVYRITDNFPHDFKLQLIKITYNSPCKIDLIGLGEVVKHIKDFVIELIKLRKDRIKSKYLEYKEMEEVKKMKLENVERFLSISKTYNLEIYELKRLMIDIDEKQDFLMELIVDEKLDHIETIPYEKKSI